MATAYLENDESDVWDRFVQYGAPLSTEHTFPDKPSAARLPTILIMVMQDLYSRPHQCDKERKVEALQALLLALWIHYPTFYRSLRQKHAQVKHWLPDEITGRHIKLKRIAAAALATYL